MEFQYKGLEAVYEKVTVTQEEVDRRMDQLRRQSPAITVITDRPTELGDEVILDYIGTCNGVAFEGGSAEDQSLTLGSGMFIPGFEEQLLGKETGASVTVEVTFPDAYPHKDLAGKPAEFACQIKEIRTRREYDLDDTFAREVGHCESLEEMRELVAESLQEHYDRRSEEELLDRLVRLAAETVDYTPSEEELQGAVEEQLQTMKAQLAQRGLELEAYCSFMGTTEEQLREDMEPEARHQLLVRATVEKIAQLENLEAEEEEIAEACVEICRMNSITPEQLEEVYDEEFAQAVRRSVIGTKALRLIRDNAKITQVNV